MAYQYTALGDSLTAGRGASFLAPGFTRRYARLSEKNLGQRIDLTVYAHSGYTTADVLKELNIPLIQKSIKEAEMITITAGGNDLIQATRDFQQHNNEKIFMEALAQCQQNFKKIIERINELKKGEVFIIRLCNLYNPFPDIPIADKWVRKFNQVIQSFRFGEHVKIADLYSAFKNRETEYLSADHIHPNDKGYQVIAEKLAELGYDHLPAK
ncbi:GDSL-type esterase/lipase family protein [Metabacillus sp. GX 13764]|uniref:GDSL-type esterase/lipase family protein n=1 Tax=Metabacillus kandeliae TaxID=2900151 RepID=UPI001E4AAB58|nr:GDSL-type esterase/lipase family protein [Metabacillus kandeliae]MCD7035816.1 GDSL-type esterase/lipase family protein [Metabacillus kandeliae]